MVREADEEQLEAVASGDIEEQQELLRHMARTTIAAVVCRRSWWPAIDAEASLRLWLAVRVERRLLRRIARRIRSDKVELVLLRMGAQVDTYCG